MKKFALLAAAFLTFAGCNQSGENRGAYSENGGGSAEGAGGAGPGYDGSGSGRGKAGTAPDSGAARQGQTGHSQTNTAMPGQKDRAY